MASVMSECPCSLRTSIASMAGGGGARGAAVGAGVSDAATRAGPVGAGVGVIVMYGVGVGVESSGIMSSTRVSVIDVVIRATAAISKRSVKTLTSVLLILGTCLALLPNYYFAVPLDSDNR